MLDNSTSSNATNATLDLVADGNQDLTGIKGNYTSYVYTEKEAIDSMWILVSAAFIILMNAGFALVESGAVSKKNRSAMLIKNLFNVFITAIAFWLSGFGIGYADPEYFVGSSYNFYASYGFEHVSKDNYMHWILEFSLVLVVVSSFQGALAERTNLSAYVIISFLIAAAVYPIIVAWTWGEGWLFEKGFYDFAGSGIVHLVAGTTALWGAICVGERRSKVRVREGREINKVNVNVKSSAIQDQLNEINPDFSSIAKKSFKNSEGELSRNNNTLIVFGTLLIWVSYFFFVGGNALTMFAARSANPPKII